MEIILLLIALIAGVVTIVFGIKQARNKGTAKGLQYRKKGAASLILALVAILLLGILSKEPANSPEKYKSIGTTGYEQEAVDIWKDKVTKMTLVDGALCVTYYTENPTTVNLEKASFYNRCTRFLEKIQGAENVTSVDISMICPVVDTYGASSDELALELIIDMSEVNKIQFDNFIPDDLPSIASHYHEARFMQ